MAIASTEADLTHMYVAHKDGTLEVWNGQFIIVYMQTTVTNQRHILPATELMLMYQTRSTCVFTMLFR